MVRYEPGSKFPEHDHPEGEEILVLEGVFSDQRGDHGPGSYLLNPEGHRHAPWSEPGWVIFVKLRQYAGQGRERPGVAHKPLYADDRFPDASRLERLAAGAFTGHRSHPAGAEIYVIDGTLEDEQGSHPAGTWLRLPPDARHEPRSEPGAILFVKEGGVASLRQGQGTGVKP